MINLITTSIKIAKDTLHYEQDRQKREQFIHDVIGQGKEIYRGYMKNKDKPWLDEVHRVFDNGVIQVVNPSKNHHLTLEQKPTITKKIARPGQIQSVFRLPFYDGIENNGKIKTHEVNKRPPEYVMKKAIYHQQQGWNKDENLPPKNLCKAVKGLRDNALTKTVTKQNNSSSKNYEYNYDPEHRHRPNGGGWEKTEKGWKKQ